MPPFFHPAPFEQGTADAFFAREGSGVAKIEREHFLVALECLRITLPNVETACRQQVVPDGFDVGGEKKGW